MRKNDKRSTIRYFRARDRFFCQDGRWWFSTREGEEGPFSSREHAEAGLKRYIDCMKMMQQFQEERDARAAQAPRERCDPNIWDRQLDAI